MAVAAIEMQRALILGLHTGQRQGDLLRLPWSGYDGVRITLRQGKAQRGECSARLSKSPARPRCGGCSTAWSVFRRWS